MKKTRIMKDSIGEIEVPCDKYWGPQTQRSKQNFTINDEKMPKTLICSLAMIKKACALANKDSKKLDSTRANLICKVVDEILSNKLDGNFPLSIWQTGSGTQTNMNVNEVISNRSLTINKEINIHPNDHVNMSQSSNDTFPTAIHLMCAILTKNKLIPSLTALINSLKKITKSFDKVIKVGRTHLQDATPIKLSQEFSAYIAMLENAKEMIEDSMKFITRIPIGGTAVGTGLNTPKNFDVLVCKHLSTISGIKFSPMKNKFHGLSSKDSVSHFHSCLKILAENLYKIANDIRWLSSGPNCGIGEIFIPQNEPGSSIMPGKVNPTQCESMMMLCIQVIANNLAITIGNTQGNFQLNTFMPMIAYNINQSVNLLADGMDSFNKKCVVGITPNNKRIKNNLDHCLMLATSLNTKIGYDKAATIVKLAVKEGISLKQAAIKSGYLTEKEFNQIVDPSKMC